MVPIRIQKQMMPMLDDEILSLVFLRKKVNEEISKTFYFQVYNMMVYSCAMLWSFMYDNF